MEMCKKRFDETFVLNFPRQGDTITGESCTWQVYVQNTHGKYSASVFECVKNHNLNIVTTLLQFRSIFSEWNFIWH